MSSSALPAGGRRDTPTLPPAPRAELCRVRQSWDIVHLQIPRKSPSHPVAWTPQILQSWVWRPVLGQFSEPRAQLLARLLARMTQGSNAPLGFSVSLLATVEG